MPETYEAYIAIPSLSRSFDLDIETISDGFSKSLVKHKYPRRNGVNIEDLGLKERTSTIRVYFGVQGGLAPYEAHFEFIEALKATDRFILGHPVYGAINGKIETVNARHDDREDCVEVDVTFIEEAADDEPEASRSVDDAAEGALFSGLETELPALCSLDAAAALGAEGSSICEKALAAGTGVAAQFTGVSVIARAWVSRTDSGLSWLDTKLIAISQPATGALAAASFVETLPGRVAGSVARCAERYAESLSGLRAFPARFSHELRAALDNLAGSLGELKSTAPPGTPRAVAEDAARDMLVRQLRVAASLRVSLEMAYAFRADQDARAGAKQTEAARSFDRLGNFLSPAPFVPLLTGDDIEAALREAQAAAQAATDAGRGIQSVKDAAAALADHARGTLIEAEKIYELDVDGVQPLHLICVRAGLPYNAAERVLAINPQIRNPSFVRGTIRMYKA